jgi:hypothetical protein
MYISKFLLIGVGLRWDNFYQPVNAEDGFTMAHVFLMLVIDCIVYAMITWYVDAVYPGDFGIPKPLCFPFMVRRAMKNLDGSIFDNGFNVHAVTQSYVMRIVCINRNPTGAERM